MFYDHSLGAMGKYCNGFIIYILLIPSTHAFLPSTTISFMSAQIKRNQERGQYDCLTIQSSKRQPINDEVLIPEDNPDIDPNTKSKLSGVVYGDVLNALHELYPPQELSKRNAISRSDGYWKFVAKGVEPPKHYTYGEFDFLFFAEILDKCNEHYMNYQNNHYGISDEEARQGWRDKVFLDIGSGTGRLVLGAAALHAFKLCKGLEILEGIHNTALEKLQKCKPDTCNALQKIDVHDADPMTSDILDSECMNDEENFDEPLSEGMSEISEALSQMTPEEWKELLGDDYDQYFDDSIVDEDVEEDSADRTDCEEDEVRDDGSDLIENMEKEDITIEEDLYKERIINARKAIIEFAPGYFLPSDYDLEKIMEDDAIVDAKVEIMHTFESIESLLEMNKDDWVKIFGNTTSALTREESETIASKGIEPKISDPKRDHQLSGLQLSPVLFNCGSFLDPYEYIGDADVVFVFSSCMTQAMIGDLSDAIGRQCKPGTIIITTEFPLQKRGTIDPLESNPNMPYGEYSIELLEEMEGFNWITTKSTAYIQRVKESLFDESGPRTKPRPKPEDQAFEIVSNFEHGRLTDTKEFMRRVKNHMVYFSVGEMIEDIEDEVDQENEEEIC